ncbi:hypothetical protein K469DRAFT_346475 [Zopfia rhizophila CBS 207.26]|uniref:SnoaL-like domain-containing protein n=1 Tax=Zopfia rhizophila CBS 207.26 TaxID=1314779 RepID=A0A6A6EQ38_9PEZI|nr:hypothetical protein K469DRAFT_346475 [Zopfia rhizophila CBS 207.26]
MRLSTATVAVIGLTFSTTITAIATPSLETLGLFPRDDTDPCALANSPSVNASIQLASWLECQVNGFFPYPENGAWDQVFTRSFAPELKATFNGTQYNYDGWLRLYKNFNVTLGKNFAPFKHGFLNTLAVPNASGDKGGFVYLIGWQGGTHTVLKRDLYFTDAAFAVVKEVYGGERRIVEFRESSNIPNTAPMPDPNEWECTFK